jgi:hypothetical protein
MRLMGAMHRARVPVAVVPSVLPTLFQGTQMAFDGACASDPGHPLSVRGLQE